jgi:hypothetical protein
MKRIITKKKKRLRKNKNFVARIKKTVLKLFNRHDKRSRLNRRRLNKNKNSNRKIDISKTNDIHKINKLQKITKKYRYDIYKNRLKNFKIRKKYKKKKYKIINNL